MHFAAEPAHLGSSDADLGTDCSQICYHNVPAPVRGRPANTDAPIRASDSVASPPPHPRSSTRRPSSGRALFPSKPKWRTASSRMNLIRGGFMRWSGPTGPSVRHHSADILPNLATSEESTLDAGAGRWPDDDASARHAAVARRRLQERAAGATAAGLSAWLDERRMDDVIRGSIAMPWPYARF